MTETEENELRVKVAEFCPNLFFVTHGSIIYWKDTGLIIREREWLAACAEFEKGLTDHAHQSAYVEALRQIIEHDKLAMIAEHPGDASYDNYAWTVWDYVSATATQRCQAFVSVMEEKR